MEAFLLFLNVIFAVATAQLCTTPNGETASCVSLLKCSILLQAAQDESTHVFIEASACPAGKLTVCCGTSRNFTLKQPPSTQSPLAQFPDEDQTPTPQSRRDYAISKLIPDKRICGQQHTDDYFYNRPETSVDEFPWLVYFVLQEDYVNSFYLRKESNCVGVLISNRYVLTLYNECLKGAWPDGGLNGTADLLFGQHHIYKNVSCLPTTVGIDDCTLPAVKEVATWWQQKQFLTAGELETISVVRLLRKLSYTDYIRPICLPLKEDEFPVVGQTIFTSGWGEPQYVNGKSVKLKKRVKYSLMGDKECEAGNDLDKPVCGLLWDNNTNYVCPGDNGGPLMYKHRNNWFVLGLISVESCSDIRPVTGEKLTSSVVDWILEAVAELEQKFSARYP